ncbi:MAG TPA: glycosyltransferase [Candidatus Omnitrophota bacterium]|nr:glycosyltransferase [Candidatus Omnitrophota bacterium]HPD85184.1 glycosyltransferase [Candidatus Omnitrophota bacterium]HRZ04315.1 glycosyltransferase [Candidatus Omnitrophota bacterium]
MNPLISVIIPTFNSELYIKECLDSALSQTYKNVEILVIDDGSADKTRALLSSYEGKIRYYTQQNRGVSSARNLGIKESRGEYIAFLDSDDAWLTTKLEFQIEFLENNKDFSCVFSDVEFFDSQSTTIGFSRRRKNIPHNGKLSISTLLRFAPFPSSVLVRSDVFREVGVFDEQLRRAGDIDLFLRIAPRYLMGLIEKPLTRYRIHGKSISQSLDSYETLISVIDRFVTKNRIILKLNPRDVNSAYYKVHIDFGKHLLFLNKLEEARVHIKIASSYKLTHECLLLYSKIFLKRCIRLWCRNS